jgi:ribosomal protein S18 acetylase RimI-like enzyme
MMFGRNSKRVGHAMEGYTNATISHCHSLCTTKARKIASTTTHDAMVQTSIATWLSKAKAVQEAAIPLEQNPTSPQGQQATATALAGASTDEIANVEKSSSNANSTSIKSVGPRTRPLPPNASITSITAETLPAFRRMTSLLLPIPYPDKFYNEILTDDVASNISLVCLWTDGRPAPERTARVVSGIRCRLLPYSPTVSSVHDDTVPKDVPSLYISTVTTLAPYRGHGLASALLRRVIARAIRDYGITTVTAHMWEANEDVREWYANHGFKEVRFEEQYYRRLRPSGAWLLERKIGPQDLLVE